MGWKIDDAFWRGFASAFDLFGVLRMNEPSVASGIYKSGPEQDRQALADDWNKVANDFKIVCDDLNDAWIMLKPELDEEIQQRRVPG